MKTTVKILATGVFPALATVGLSQPTIVRLQLSGQAATIYDNSQVYLSNSVSLGANVLFNVTASGTPPLHYQWQFNQSDLPNERNSTLNFPSLNCSGGAQSRMNWPFEFHGNRAAMDMTALHKVSAVLPAL